MTKPRKPLWVGNCFPGGASFFLFRILFSYLGVQAPWENFATNWPTHPNRRVGSLSYKKKDVAQAAMLPHELPGHTLLYKNVYIMGHPLSFAPLSRDVESALSP